MNNFRAKASSTRYSHADVLDYSFNQQAGALKMLGPIIGKLIPLGDGATARAMSQRGKLAAVYNTTAGTLFAKTGDSTVAAPTGGTDSVCLPPLSYTIIALDQDTHVRTSASCFVYEVVDDTHVNPNSGVSS